MFLKLDQYEITDDDREENEQGKQGFPCNLVIERVSVVHKK